MNNIYISPSNQCDNEGYGNYKTEQYRMFQLGNFLYTILKRCGNTVYISKKGMTYQQAVTESNNLHCDIHLALHSNAFNKTCRGTLSMYKSVNGQKLAQAIYNQLAAFTPTEDRGYYKNDGLYELNQTNAICAYLEIMFHDNKDDANLIINNIEHIAELIGIGVCQYFKVPFVAKSNAKIVDNKVIDLQKVCNKLGILGANGLKLSEDNLDGTNTQFAKAKLKIYIQNILG